MIGRRRHLGLLAFAYPLCLSAQFAWADQPTQLADLSPHVLRADQREQIVGMLERDIERRRRAANERNLADWRAIKNKEDWERYRDVRRTRLAEAVGAYKTSTGGLDVTVTGRVAGDGYVIENVAYEPYKEDYCVPGNLYLPAKPVEKPPGILIVHSHHRDKLQGELQDMGMTWARAGCAVLVIDLPGYGERRAHPFHAPADFPRDETYPVSRQDYFHRYDSGIQLQIAGNSLMAWMLGDIEHGIDLLLQHAGADEHKLIILGAVAGGGDPAALAALDERIDCCVPFNFGGPQPENEYPLPVDAEDSFNYLMSSYWDSTRGLRRTAADGFFHWLIVGSIAPRKLIYAHEFAWDRERDPVWKRYEQIWGEWYGKPGNLAFTHGRGSVRGSSPEDTHCTNIGPFHRQRIHAAFKEWFGIDVAAESEYSKRLPHEKLTVLTPKARAKLKPKTFVELVAALGKERADQARQRLGGLSPEARRMRLQEDWKELLGDIAPSKSCKTVSINTDEALVSDAIVERILLETEPGIHIPLLLLRPTQATLDQGLPVVVAVSHAGKQGFLEHRSADIESLLADGTLVCLPDLRGTGETKEGDARDRTSGDTDRSVNLAMFGETLLGQRLRDLRNVLAYLRTREDVRDDSISLWGDSFAAINPRDADFQVPHGVEDRPRQSEPLGGLLALLGALFEPEIHAVYMHGGLASYESVLEHYQVLVPHDAAVPLALKAGDLCALAAVLAPRPLRLEGLVDGRNQTLDELSLKAIYQLALDNYESDGASGQLTVSATRTSAARWLTPQP